MPATRTTSTWRSRDIACAPLPMTASEDRNRSSRKPADGAGSARRRAGGGRSGRHLPASRRSPTIRAILRRSAPLARVVVEGEPLPMRLPTTLGGAAPLASIRDEEITNTAPPDTIGRATGISAAANYQEFAFLICGQAIRPESRRPSRPARRGRGVDNRQRARRRPCLPHPHQSISRWWRSTARQLARRDWHDTVVVPRNGSVTFRSRFLDFTGRFVLHCHMMNHEELGMMQVVEVYAPSMAAR